MSHKTRHLLHYLKMEEELGKKIKQLSSSLDVLMQLQKRAASSDFEAAICERENAPPLRVTKERIRQYKTAWKQNFHSLQRDYRVALSYSADTRYRDRALGTFRPRFVKKLENLLGDLPAPVNIQFVIRKLEMEQSAPLETHEWGKICLREVAAQALGVPPLCTLDDLRHRLYAHFTASAELMIMPTVMERYLQQRKTHEPLHSALALYPQCDQLQLKTRHPGIHALAVLDCATDNLKPRK